MKNELVSIITPSFNSLQYIKETIVSIQNQTYTNWELIITDDCSTDGTIEFIKKLSLSDARIKCYQLSKNCGAGVARNNSIRYASGNYIAFCDSDDLWTLDKLEKQLAFLEVNNLSFTCSAYQKIDEDGNKMGIFYPPEKITFNDLLKSCSIGCLTAIYDVSKIGKIYMPDIRRRQDYGLWLKIFKIIGSTEVMSTQVTAYYRIRKDSISRNKIRAALFHYQILREYGEGSFLKSIYYFIIYFTKGLIKFLK
jgi:teichuronic acid biosynthesis glycosyltransferase TuaG